SDDQLLDDLAVWRHPQSWADGVDLPTWHTGSAKPEPFEWAGERNVEPGDSTKLWSCRHLRLVGQDLREKLMGARPCLFELGEQCFSILQVECLTDQGLELLGHLRQCVPAFFVFQFDKRPAELFFRQGSQAVRYDSPPAKGLNEGNPISMLVVPDCIEIGGD